MSAALVLGRYDAGALCRLFSAAGVLAALERRGFTDLAVQVDAAGRALPHTLLYARKGGERRLLLDACLGEAVLNAGSLAAGAEAIERPLELLVVHWVREEDPTVGFSAERPRLPLQRHPGLGVLRRAFRVAAGIARELGKDAVASVPKFFHDAVIFHRSRIFLFLDAAEQGRFEALVRDLAGLPLGQASLALAGGAVSDESGAVLPWAPGYQAFPIAAQLERYFRSPAYAETRGRARDAARFTLDPAALRRTLETVARARHATRSVRRRPA